MSSGHLRDPAAKLLQGTRKGPWMAFTHSKGPGSSPKCNIPIAPEMMNKNHPFSRCYFESIIQWIEILEFWIPAKVMSNDIKIEKYGKLLCMLGLLESTVWVRTAIVDDYIHFHFCPCMWR